jgi:hypothetical protein
MLVQAQIMQIQADVATKQAEMERKREQTMIDAQLKVLELQQRSDTQITEAELRRSTVIAREVMKAEADMVKDIVRGENQATTNPRRA